MSEAPVQVVKVKHIVGLVYYINIFVLYGVHFIFNTYLNCIIYNEKTENAH